MSYEHQRWENRVFLYGHSGKLTRDAMIEKPDGEKVLEVGFYLRVSETMPKTGKLKTTYVWCKARRGLAEKIKLKFTSPRWIRIEGRLGIYNGHSIEKQLKGNANTWVEIMHMWWEDAEGRQDSTVVCLKTEYDRLRKIEEAWSTGVSRFHIPEEKKAALLEYLHDEDEEPAKGVPAAPPLKMTRAERNGDEPGVIQQAQYTRKRRSRRPRRPRFDQI